MRCFALLGLAGLTTLVTASPLVVPSKTQPIKSRQDNSTTSAPCAQVSQYIYGDGSAAIRLSVPAKLAYDCLLTVPFNATSGKRLITSLRPYINWQSTLTVLKDPPAEYAAKVQPPIDIVGGLDQMEKEIDAGKYKSEYQFGWTLYTLILAAHDGHFSYVPDSVGGIFNWGRPTPLVSVSEDGKKLPTVFVFTDVLGSQFKNISYTPSPIVKIDGVDVYEYLENLSLFGGLQDRDALWNSLFYELAQVSLYSSGLGTGMFTGGGRGRLVYPGGTNTFTFANGSSYTQENYARALVSFRNITTGEKLAESWFNYGTAFSGEIDSVSPAQPVQTPAPAELNGISGAAPGFPNPVVAGPVNLINAFYVEGAGYEDVAVLQVPNFVGISSVGAAFQKVTQDFLPKALAAGKTKLILDIQANGGGTILQGYDMFKQLFPDLDPYGANRFRATEAADLVGQSYSAFASQFPRRTTSNGTITNAQGSYFDYHQDMTVDGKPFNSWAEKFGPVEVNGDKYTTLNRWNLSDVYIPYSSGGINITGYGPLANITGPPRFKPENIVIVSDGYCASTCTIFAEFLTQQAGVKTIAMGGRRTASKIQAIGGVKGVNNYGGSYIQSLAQNAIRYTPALNSSILRRDYYSNLPFIRGSSLGLNVRDGLRQNDTSGVALQFIYEEADCRLYYTPEMTVDIQALWRAAADAQWGASGKCVSGSADAQKRSNLDVTTKLGPRRVHITKAQADRKIKAFEDTFSLETDCKMKADGFMAP